MGYYAYMSDEAPSTFIMTLAGREISFKRPLLGQIIVLERSARRIMEATRKQGGDEGVAITRAMVRTLDFIETLIVSDDDRQFVEDHMMSGDIDWMDLIKSLSGGLDEDTPADDEAPKPVKRAPRKSPKAAPVAKATAKTVASRGRTKR